MEGLETGGAIGGVIVLAYGLIGIIKMLINKRKNGNSGSVPSINIMADKQDVKLCDEKHLHINEKLADIKRTSDDSNKKIGNLVTEVALLREAVNGG